MAIQSSYFENRINNTAIEPQASQPAAATIQPVNQQNTVTPSLEDQVNKNLRAAINKAQTEYYEKQANRPAVSYIPQIATEAILGKDLPNWGLDTKENINDIARGTHAKLTGVSNEEYMAMSDWEKAKVNTLAGPRMAWNLIKGTGKFIASLPKNMIKAPIYLSQSAFNLTGRALNKITGTNIWDTPDRLDLPILGEVRTAGLSYDEGIAMGMSPFLAAIKASGETAGEIAIGIAPVSDINKLLFKPRNIVLKSKTIVDPRPLVGEAIEQTTAAGAKTLTVSEFKQNKNILTIGLPKSEAAKYGGNSNNTFLMLKPKGSGLAEQMIVQQRKSVLDMGLDAAKKVFGKKNVVPGENGPLLQLQSSEIKYNPNFFDKSLAAKGDIEAVTASYPSLSKILDDIKTTGSIKAETAKAVSTAQAYQFYSPNVEENLTFSDALTRTKSGSQILYRKIGEDIDKQLGYKSQSFDAIGDWSDGAENTVFNTIEKVNSYEELKYSTALKGKIGKQKSVIPFMVDQAGADSLFITDIQGKNLEEIRASLDEFGLKYRTLVEGKSENKIVIFDQGSQLGDKIDQFSKIYNADVTIRKGKGEFLGSDVSREAGIAEYDKVISGYEAIDGVTKYNPETFKVGEYTTKDRNLVDPFTRNRMARKDPNKVLEGQFQEPPSIMAKPLKGFEDKPITDKQVDQVLGLAADLELNETIVQAVAQTFASKDNIYNLTQNELYQVSEIIRSFPKKEVAKEPYDVGKYSSFMQLSRTWMSNAEIMSEQAGKIVPVDSEVRIPIENGIRLSRIFRDEWNNKFNEVLGEYNKLKHTEERRLISSYVEGNKNSILKNDSLSQQDKMELSQIGDWFIKYFEDSFKNKDLGLTHSRWVGTYLPQLKKAGGINLLYKEKEIPSELKVFAQFEREGQLNVLEDDILVLAQVYNNAVAKTKFLKQPYDHAVKVIAAAPDNIKARASDWLQEVMGRRDDLEKAFHNWGKNLSKKTGGIIPENISKQILSLVLSNSYAGALGLPRFMPPIRNLIGQAVLLPYAEFGPMYFKSFAKWVNKDGIAELKRRGFDVKSGVIYGAEVSEKLGQGPIGKTIDKYKKINEISMVSEGWPDLINRTATMGATIDRFDDAYKLLKDGKIDYETFLGEINFNGYSPTVQRVLNKLLTKGTDESLFEAKELAIKETLDSLQFGYRKGSGAAFHHGLRGKMLGQFTLFNWGYTTMIRDWVVRKQYDKLIRFLGMSANLDKSFKEELGIDASKWVGFGPLSVPISPMVRLGMLTTEGTANAVGDNEQALNKNYKEITRSLKLYLGVAGGVGAQRWGKVFESIKDYEEGKPVYDPRSGQQAFPLRAANGKMIWPANFGELLMYGAGFDVDAITKQFKMLNIINRAMNNKKNAEDKAMRAFVSGDFEKFNEIYVDNALYFNPADRLDSYQKSILQRVFDRMDNREKLKWYNIVTPIIYGK